MEKWISLEDENEDILSLSDFPETGDRADNLHAVGEASRCPEAEDFEFFGSGSLHPKTEEDHMCVADEVFFQGQMLPMDRSCSSRTNGSIGFDSSGSMSRSQSTDSSRSDSRRASISSNFYTHPSPKPHLPTGKYGFDRRRGRRSASAPAVGILLFGLVRAPEFELGDFRHRKVGACQSNGKVKTEKKPEKNRFGFFRNRFGCRCSAGDALEPISCCASTQELTGYNRGKEEEALVSHRRQHRTFQWLEELSAPKGHDS